MKYTTKTKEEFIGQSNLIHENKYIYDEVEYIGCNVPVCIICKIHGRFYQKPRVHLQLGGCKFCYYEKCKNNKTKNTQYFIEKAKTIHGEKYDYSKTFYKGNKNKLIIICPKHGEFLIRASSHLEKRKDGKMGGCSKCSNNRTSANEQKWLDMMNVEAKNRQVKIETKENKYYIVDAYIPETNTVYEFNGDYWHGNLSVYSPDEINKNKNKTFGQLFEETIQKEKDLREAGYNLIVMWEKDFKNLIK